MSEGPSPKSEVESACAFVLARLDRAKGTRARQGARAPALPCKSSLPLVRRIAEERFYRLPTEAARAIVAWADGFPITVFREVPKASQVLSLQARGERCVSLLADGVSTAPHADALAFAVHDLCHLAKFSDHEHYVGQVGFFALLERAYRRALGHLVRRYDAAFGEDIDRIASDMNGSAIFLFAALKMKLKMAVRRKCAMASSVPAPCSGPLTERELVAYEEALDELLAALELAGDVASAARRVSTKRDHLDAARLLLRHFEECGRSGLSPDGAKHAWSKVANETSSPWLWRSGREVVLK